MPGYLLDHLATTTGIDHRTVSRKARRHRCPRCALWTLRGLDGDAMAHDVRVDLIPLSPLGEAVAVVIGVGSWSVRRVGGETGSHLELDVRDQWSISGKPAGSIEGVDVIPGHRCGMTWTPALRSESRLNRDRARSS